MKTKNNENSLKEEIKKILERKVCKICYFDYSVGEHTINEDEMNEAIESILKLL